MTKVEFAECMAPLTELEFVRISKRGSEVWWQLLKDIDLETLKTAVLVFIADDGKFLTPAKLRKLADEVAHGQPASYGEAIGRLSAAVRSYGCYAQPAARAALDELTWATVRAVGGWNRVCECEHDGVFRAQFRDAYNALSQQAVRHRALPAELRPRLADNSVRKLAASMAMPKAR